MDVYTIILKWLYPKGLIKDRKGNVIQKAEPGPRQIILVKALPSLDAAKEIGNELWRKHYIGKQKRITILKYTGKFPTWEDVAEVDNLKS